MEIVNKCLNKDDFKAYIRSFNFGSLPPNSIVVHHTWRPTVEQWQGQKSIMGLKSFYEGKGWSAAPHIFIAPDGIWLFTSMYEAGIHAGTKNAKYVNSAGRTYNGYLSQSQLSGAYRGYFLKEYSIGIEVIGDYDKSVWSGNIYNNAVSCIDTLQKSLRIIDKEIWLHRDFTNTKSCPGSAITKEWIIEQLKNYNTESNVPTHEPDDVFKGLDKWEVDTLKKAITLGITKNGERARDNATRVEVMAMILNALDIKNT
jgi:hypothetical protein